MGCNLFILAQKQFDYFLPPSVGAKIPVLHLELLHLFLIIPLFSLLSISIISTIYSVYGRCSQYKLFGICPDLDLTSLLIYKPSLTPLSAKVRSPIGQLWDPIKGVRFILLVNFGFQQCRKGYRGLLTPCVPNISNYIVVQYRAS